LTVLCLVAVLAAGCVNRLAQREARLNQFIGHPESLLVQAFGVPDKSIETGGVKYLAYSERRLDVIPGSPSFVPGMWPYSWYGPYGPPIPPQVIDLECETTFAVTGGIVRSYTLRGNACG
jgi:hypothetical protein